jgi:hypothetical protein
VKASKRRYGTLMAERAQWARSGRRGAVSRRAFGLLVGGEAWARGGARREGRFSPSLISRVARECPSRIRLRRDAARWAYRRERNVCRRDSAGLCLHMRRARGEKRGHTLAPVREVHCTWVADERTEVFCNLDAVGDWALRAAV